MMLVRRVERRIIFGYNAGSSETLFSGFAFSDSSVNYNILVSMRQGDGSKEARMIGQWHA
jgi:hypothetical protein